MIRVVVVGPGCAGVPKANTLACKGAAGRKITAAAVQIKTGRHLVGLTPPEEASFDSLVIAFAPRPAGEPRSRDTAPAEKRRRL